jgi:hypothetical protein
LNNFGNGIAATSSLYEELLSIAKVCKVNFEGHKLERIYKELILGQRSNKINNTNNKWKGPSCQL